MKRYRIKLFDRTQFNQMIDHPIGEWVKWEDVKGILQYKDQLKGFKLGSENLKCICEEMYEQVQYAHADGSDASWFCPAHGYKKR